MPLTLPIKTAIERGFILRATYQGGERAGQTRDVLVLALMVRTPGPKSRKRDEYLAWLVYDPTAYHHSQAFSTMQITLTRFLAVVAASHVPMPRTPDDIYTTQTARLGRSLWETKGHELPRGFSPMWRLDEDVNLPNIAEVQASVQVVLER